MNCLFYIEIITIFSAIMITTVIIIPVYYFYYVLQIINLSGGLLFLFCIIQLLRAARKRVEFSIFFLLLIFFCLILLLNDILIAMQVLNPPYLLPYGFVCFLIIICVSLGLGVYRIGGHWWSLTPPLNNTKACL